MRILNIILEIGTNPDNSEFIEIPITPSNSSKIDEIFKKGTWINKEFKKYK